MKTAPPESVGSLLATIVDNNIFNPGPAVRTRCSGRGRSNRVELSLVGTFEIGDCKGAIILQKSASNNRNFPGMWGGGGSLVPAGPDASGNRRRAGGGPEPFRQLEPRRRRRQRQQCLPHADGALRQYVRIGETLANGYTLTEITRTGAVLTRGSDKMELELQEPSKNQAKASTGTNNNRRGNFFQQMQQMQQMQMMQNFQMMRMMRDTVRNQNQNRNPGGNRGGNAGGRVPAARRPDGENPADCFL